MLLFKILASLGLATVLASAALSQVVIVGPVQYQPSVPDALFVPDQFVPLSEFVDRQSVPAGPIVLVVDPGVLSTLVGSGATISVAHSMGTTISYLVPTSIDTLSGQVTIPSALAGDYVVVSDVLVNDFPVVTHWDASANLGRGGQVPGATDGSQVFTYDPLTGNVKAVGTGFKSTDPNHFDPGLGPVDGLYTLATDLFAPFSDGTELTPRKDGDVADADTPGFERFVGENYATNGVSDLAAIWLSDQSRVKTGFPIVHRNDQAFTSSPGLKVADAVPAFQFVHCLIVDFQDPAVVGSEQSLSTFVLPPFWEAEPEADYPLLVNGFYDIHASTFGVVGSQFLQTLGDLLAIDREYKVVGVLWNGGGAGAQTMHSSAHGNMSLLMDMAEQLAYGHPRKIIFRGGSRGGTTALEMASNPADTTYSGVYAIASNPQTTYGEAFDVMCNPTYSLVQTSIVAATGYAASWQSTWLSSGGKTGKQLAAITLVGTDDFDLIDATVANIAPPVVAGLAAKGTSVLMRASTHDFSRSFQHAADYDAALRAAGVPLLTEMGFRFGHSHPLGNYPDVVDLFVKLFTGDTTFPTGLVFYRPDGSGTVGASELFTNDHVPLVLEAPALVGMTQPYSYTVAGEPGAFYEMRIAKMDDAAWTVSQTVVLTTPLTSFLLGQLPSTAGALVTADTHPMTLPLVPGSEGFWFFELRYSVDGVTVHTVSSGATAFINWPNEPVTGLATFELIGVADKSRTGGVSADVLF